MWRKHRYRQAWGGGGSEEREGETETERKSKNERECFGGGLNHLYEDRPPWIPLANHLALSVLEPTFSLTQGPPLCAGASFGQDGFQRKGLCEVDWTYYGLVPLLSLTPEEPFCEYVVPFQRCPLPQE